MSAEALGRHAVAVASVRALGERSGAERVVLLLDEGDGLPATMLEWAPSAPIELTEAGVTHELPADAASEVAAVALPDVRPVPASAVAVDPELGELAAPIGVLAGLAGAVLALAGAFGGRSVATLQIPTREPAWPLSLAARAGEPVVASVGGGQFAFPEGWP